MPYSEEEDVYDERKSAAVVVIVITVLMLISVVFEEFKHYLEHNITKALRPVLESLFSELTILGFITLLLFVVGKTEILTSFSRSLFGEEEGMKVNELLETVHMVIFLDMVVFLLWVTWNLAVITRSGRNSHLAQLRRENDLALVVRTYFRDGHRTAQSVFDMKYAARSAQFERNVAAGFGITERDLDAASGFDLASYLDNQEGRVLAHIVEVPVKTWLLLELLCVVGYAIFLGNGNSSEAVAIVVFAWAVLLLALLVRMKLSSIESQLFIPTHSAALSMRADLIAKGKWPRDETIFDRTSASVNHPKRSIKKQDGVCTDPKHETLLMSNAAVQGTELEVQEFGHANDRDPPYLRTQAARNFTLESHRCIRFLFWAVVHLCGLSNHGLGLHEHNHAHGDHGHGDHGHFEGHKSTKHTIFTKHETLFWLGAFGPSFLVWCLRVIGMCSSIFIAVFVVWIAETDAICGGDNAVACGGTVAAAVVPFVCIALVSPGLLEKVVLVCSVEMLTNRAGVKELLRARRTEKSVRALRLFHSMDYESKRTRSTAENQRRQSIMRVAVEEIYTDPTVLERERNKYRDLFDLFDRDGSGCIHDDEVEELLLSLGIADDDDMSQKIINEIDTDGNGTIEFDEFFTWVATQDQQGYSQERTTELAHRIFAAIDADGSGKVSCEELREALDNVGHSLSPAECQSIINDADRNRDGEIDVHEFALMMSDHMRG